MCILDLLLAKLPQVFDDVTKPVRGFSKAALVGAGATLRRFQKFVVLVEDSKPVSNKLDIACAAPFPRYESWWVNSGTTSG